MPPIRTLLAVPVSPALLALPPSTSSAPAVPPADALLPLLVTRGGVPRLPYSNINYVLLGPVVEQVTGRSYAAEPAAMCAPPPSSTADMSTFSG
ncbi:hypothetical protein ACH5AO_08500 [Streptomyces sp. NPDC018964]|uniref:hypothetical protein n=1 Tax=unclassified Streptomyces TaxID=2593676 RepID=UPI00378D57BC